MGVQGAQPRLIIHSSRSRCLVSSCRQQAQCSGEMKGSSRCIHNPIWGEGKVQPAHKTARSQTLRGDGKSMSKNLGKSTLEDAAQTLHLLTQYWLLIVAPYLLKSHCL